MAAGMPTTIVPTASQAELSRITRSERRRRSPGHFVSLESIKDSDPALDPTSGKLEPCKWARPTFRRLDEEGILRECAGIAFKNLNVPGSGTALQI
jgi:ATP-binding cassette, subfamily G (WHITE), member 2, PDR